MLINWTKVFFASIWIFAVSSWLAALSYWQWKKQFSGIGWKELWNSRKWQTFQLGCMGIFSIGMGGVQSAWGWRIIWWLLALSFLIQLGYELRKRK